MARIAILMGWTCVCLGLLALAGAFPVDAAQPKRRAKAAGPAAVSAKPSPGETAAKVDALITSALKQDGITIEGLCNDEDYLRRVSLDITGITPTTQDVTLFGLDFDSNKREKLVDRLLEDAEYGKNWSRYWRDVIYLRATSQFGNLGRAAFEEWMAGQLQSNEPWDKIVTALLTASGDVREQGQTALFAVHQAEPEEVAAEASRIFLGIQLQCANCHDHPTDRWKRNQFHELAAYFPRVRFDRRLNVQPPVIQVVSLEGNMADRGQQFRDLLSQPEKLMELIDRNKDGKITKEEASRGPNEGRFFNVIIERGDTDKDGAVSLKELKNFPAPMQQTGRGSAEYYMPNLDNPQSRGTKIDPGFFLASTRHKSGMDDQERRGTLAKEMTDRSNAWFAKAFVNRMWGALVGEGFYMPVDDIGPDRSATCNDALEALSAAFIENDYDTKWLFRTIAATETYQRKIRQRDPKKNETFASAIPTRLRADQLYSSLLRVMGVAESSISADRTRMPMAGQRFGDQSPRGQFGQLFGFDPSTTPDDLNGTVPQALFLMNSPQIQGLIRASGPTRLAEILRKYPSDKDAILELYLLVHTREPSAKELQVCQTYIKDVGNRNEALEDLLWSLVNSTEFLTKR